MANELNQNTLLKGLISFEEISFAFGVKDEDTTQTYRVKYTSGLSDFTSRYKLQYTSYNVYEVNDTYKLTYTSIFGDVLQQYRVRYFSGRDTREFVDRFYVRYTSSFTAITAQQYKIRFNTTGSETSAHRARYKVKYTSDSPRNHNTTYRLKYTLSSFYNNAVEYKIKYTTTGAESLLVRSALIRNDSTTDAVFEIRGIEDIPMDSYLYVLSNMPKYQTVEYTIGENLPYVQFINPSELTADVFDLDGITSYEVKGYILLRNVEDLNGVSLDIYDIEGGYTKVNKSKTYFFGLTPNDYIDTLLSVKGSTYYQVNRASDVYSPEYLNYVATSVTPTFRFGIDCCFSRKINKTNYSYCSPF